MTKLLFCSINTKYIHTNLALRYLKNHIAAKTTEFSCILKEFNINQQLFEILREITAAKPEVILFSVYIWNIEYVLKIAKELKKLLAETKIIIGGPEASAKAEKILEQYPAIDNVIKGEGEETLLEFLSSKNEITKGLYYRKNEQILFGGDRAPLKELDNLPFPYAETELTELKEQILYYESSRGCPFGCAYCLSGNDNIVRYFSLERVKKDLQVFLDHRVKLVKFVDRTFNLEPERTLAIWKYIAAHHNNITTFHFEIAGDLLTAEQLVFLQDIPSGMFQFEIGIQSTNDKTLSAVNRKTNIEKIVKNIEQLNKNIHTHLDLIAGLPFEDLQSFGQGIDLGLKLNADMFQLGFLKILPGTEMEKIARTNNYLYLDTPPYEVLSTPWLSTTDLFRLKYLEKLIDIYYNSQKFRKTLYYTFKNNSPFAFLSSFADFLIGKNIFSAAHNTLVYFTLLYEFLEKNHYEQIYFELLKYDFISLGKHSRFPAWYKRNYSKNDHYTALSSQEQLTSPRESLAKTDLEIFSVNPKTFENQETKILFIYGQPKTITYTLK